MELSFEQIHRYWEARHPGQRIPAREKVSVCCVLHGEKNPSCTLYLDGNGGFNCHACGAKGNLFQFEVQFSKCTLQQAELNVAEITGARPSAPMGDLGPPVAFYDYRDENGMVLFQKRRFEPELGKKMFLVYRPTSKGWESKIDPPDGAKTRRVLFNLPDLVKANVAILAEGEKCAIAAMTANLFANAGYNIACTTTFDGAWQETHTPKWLEIYNAYFTGKFVIIFADNDAPGRLYAETAAAGIAKFAYRVRIIYFPELPEGGDIADFLETRTTADLEEKIKSAPVWTGEKSERKNWLVEAVDWVSTSDARVDWLIDGVIQRDANGIIAAEPKTGKSLIAVDLLLSLATGCDWLGRVVPHRVRTAYVSREDSPLLTKARVKGFLANKGLKYDFVTGDLRDATGWLWCNTREQLGEFDVDVDEHLRNMAHDLKERGVEFAIFDVFNRLHNRSENDNTEMAQVVQRISQMGTDAGCAIGVIHHVSKENSSGRFFTRIRGASSLHGWTEWSIGLSLINPGSGGPITRKAEFETKASVPCDEICFTVISKNEGLALEIVKPGTHTTTTSQTNTASQPYVMSRRYMD